MASSSTQGNLLQIVPARPAQVTITEHAPGFGYTRATIKKMAELAREGSHSYAIRHLATEITRNVPSKAPRLELEAIYKWVRDNIRYRYDPLGLEWVQSPERTVLEGAGDCDDMTVLICALAGSLGHPWQFRTVGPTPTTQAHVAAQCFDRTKWLDLDPVIEPTQATTAPRPNDLGRFGVRAMGHEHIWNREGNMLSGVSSQRRRRRPGRVDVSAYSRRFPQLGGVVFGAPAPVALADLLGNFGMPCTREDAELWYWNTYYPPVPPTTEWGLHPPQGGVYPTPDVRYRSPNAPGFEDGKRAGGVQYEIWLSRGAIPDSQLSGDGTWPVPVWDETLGWGFLKKLKKGFKKIGKGIVHGAQAVAKEAHHLTHTGFIRKAEKGIQNIVGTAIPIAKPFIQLHEKVFAPLTEKALSKVGAVRKDEVRKLDIKGGVSSAAKSYAAAQSGGKGGSSYGVNAGSVVRNLPNAAKVAQAARSAAPAVRSAMHASSQLRTAVAHAVSKPPALKLPSMFTHAPASSAVRIVKAPPKAAIPAHVVASSSTPAHFTKPAVPALRRKYPANARMLYDRALKKFRVFVPHGTAALHGFHSYVGGAATLAGAHAYVGGAATLAGAHAYVGGAATLAGAGRSFPVGRMAGIRPSFTIAFGAPVPASSRPDVVAAAHKALSAVQTFMKNHANKPPAVRLPAVLAFQNAEKGLEMDGLYGTNTRAAMAYYLPGVKLPPNAPGLNSKLYWKPAEQAAPTPKPTPKPTPVVAVTPKPPPRPVNTTTPQPSFGTPAGYTEVGQETQNPGLPPVGYDTKTGTAQGTKGTVRPVTPVKPVKPVKGKGSGKGTVKKPPRPVVPVVTPVPAIPPAPVAVPGPDGSLVPVIEVTGPRVVDVDAWPADMPQPTPPLPNEPPLPNVDTTPQPSWPGVTNWPAECPQKDNTLLWLGLLYFWQKSRRHAA